MKEIPFDLEKAKAGEPILAFGRPARFLIHVPEARPHQQVVVLGDDGYLVSFTNDGRLIPDEAIKLTMAPKKRVVWVNVYTSSSLCVRYDTKELADIGSGSDRIACVRVEFTEGEGL